VIDCLESSRSHVDDSAGINRKFVGMENHDGTTGTTLKKRRTRR
jgi:hypothetical protein